MLNGQTAFKGALGQHVIGQRRPSGVWQAFKYHGIPRKDMPDEVRRWRVANFKNVWRGMWSVMLAHAAKKPYYHGTLYNRIIRPNEGADLWYGLAGFKVVTDVGVGYIVDAFQNSVELEDMKYHGIGISGSAEAAGDTILDWELTTEYSSDNTRATGTTTEGATANIYRTVATNTVDAAVALLEHGIFSNAARGSGVLLDRTVFAAINLGNGDSVQHTYDLTLSSGS